MPFPFSQWTGIFECNDDSGNFISSLLKGLKQAGIDCSRSRIREDTSSPIEIPPETKFALVVFSKGLVNSNRRLDELVTIPRPNSGHVIIPIFYTDGAAVVVDGEFVLALQTGNKKEKLAKETKWSALAKAEKNSGRAANKTSSPVRNLIDKIVGRLVNEMHSRCFGEEFTFGPFGGEGQNDPNTVNIEKIDERGKERKEIVVEYGDFIKSVDFKVHRETGTKPEHGGDDRNRTYKVKLEQTEYITSFAGSKRKTDGNGVRIISLTFRTNKRILGPIGKEKEEEKNEQKEEEEYFSVPLDAGKVIEFYWGQKDNFLISVGALVKLRSKDFNSFESELFGRKGVNCSTWTMDDGRKNVIRIDQKEKGGPFIQLTKLPYKEEDEKKIHGKRGLDKEEKTKIFKLLQGEYLTSISGYYTTDESRRDTDISITSLTFRTNKRMAVTFGEEEEDGIYFSSPAMACKIVDFDWYNDEHQNLCGIEARFGPISDHKPYKSIGSSGGSSGDTWDYGKFKGVMKIVVEHYDNNIHCINFEYADGSELDKVKCGRWCGRCKAGNSPERTPIAEKKLDYPREYLTSMSGYVGEEDGAIKSLTFYSNKRRIVFGNEEKGKYYFWYPSAGSRIIGLHGSEAPAYIGLHVEPIPHLYPFRTVGPPMKGRGGKPWNDGVHTNVRGFRVTTTEHQFRETTTEHRNKEIIESITFMYDDNGSLVTGDQHGGGDASGEQWVMLNFPKERLERIEGYMRENDGQTVIHDLTIVPTVRESFSYAVDVSERPPTPNKFSIPVKDGWIVGFFGTAGNDHLNSIGAWLEPY